jgi:hypothetical protein
LGVGNAIGCSVEKGGLGGAVVAGFLALLLVTAGAEGIVAGAGEGDDADGGVGAGSFEAPNQFVNGVSAKGVVAVGAIDGDPGESAVGLVEDIGEFATVHGDLLQSSIVKTRFARAVLDVTSSRYRNLDLGRSRNVRVVGVPMGRGGWTGERSPLGHG